MFLNNYDIHMCSFAFGNNKECNMIILIGYL